MGDGEGEREKHKFHEAKANCRWEVVNMCFGGLQ